ncbi:hypothetical protein M5U04_05615 [Xenorhabdus sp. XENO-1]|uniref:hypothetical protein n=1 Tax=Xenorhabdus bovienii TaxID=40576 RepID=UPI0020CA5066|nr:hypothetical protein [Xenorhabdus bovienii]MCP9267587.1 hypothetical protein [Xenorhabdus bovienii subsp. africana]
MSWSDRCQVLTGLNVNKCKREAFCGVSQRLRLTRNLLRKWNCAKTVRNIARTQATPAQAECAKLQTAQ